MVGSYDKIVGRLFHPLSNHKKNSLNERMRRIDEMDREVKETIHLEGGHYTNNTMRYSNLKKDDSNQKTETNKAILFAYANPHANGVVANMKIPLTKLHNQEIDFEMNMNTTAENSNPKQNFVKCKLDISPTKDSKSNLSGSIGLSAGNIPWRVFSDIDFAKQKWHFHPGLSVSNNVVASTVESYFYLKDNITFYLKGSGWISSDDPFLASAGGGFRVFLKPYLATITMGANLSNNSVFPITLKTSYYQWINDVFSVAVSAVGHLDGGKIVTLNRLSAGIETRTKFFTLNTSGSSDGKVQFTVAGLPKVYGDCLKVAVGVQAQIFQPRSAGFIFRLECNLS